MPRKPTARIFRGTSRNLSYLARCLRDGDIVGVPTETVYGLAADALNPRACQKIFTAKGRPTTDPLIVHIAALDELDAIAVTNTAALRLAQKFWPGPLTLILPKKPVVPAIVSAGLPSVAVRMPAHALFRRLIRLSGRPLAAEAGSFTVGGGAPDTVGVMLTPDSDKRPVVRIPMEFAPVLARLTAPRKLLLVRVSVTAPAPASIDTCPVPVRMSPV